jgi:predicted RNase H-like HicB family nuclease
LDITMVTAIYPAIVEHAGQGFSVYFPDLPGCTSAGRTVMEAALNAEEALAGHLAESARHGEELPPASDLGTIERDPEVSEIARLVVRAEKPGKAVRLNITLDEGLVAAIDRVAQNRSGFLAEAAREALARRRQAEAI